MLSPFQYEEILLQKDTLQSVSSEALVWQKGESCGQTSDFFESFVGSLQMLTQVQVG